MPGLTSRTSTDSPASFNADAALRQSQIITLALIIGLLLGSGVLGFMGLTNAGSASTAPSTPTYQPPLPAVPSSQSSLTDVFAVMVPSVWVVMLCVVVFIPGFMARSTRTLWEARADDEAAMGKVYQGFVKLSIIHAALMEGPGLLGAVAALLTGNALMLLAPLASVVVLALLFPRTSRLNRWVEEATGTLPVGAPPTASITDDEAA